MRGPTTPAAEPMLGPMLTLASPFSLAEATCQTAATMNTAVADPAAVGAPTYIGGAGGAICAVVAAYAPGGAMGAAHHDGDAIAGFWSDGGE